MKNVIKSLALAAVILVSGASFTACKKGENDPGLSMKIRYGRLTGEWKLIKGEAKSSSGGVTTTETIDGTTYTYTAGGSSAITGTFVGVFTADKDGTYTMVQTRTIGGNATVNTEKGNWSWVGKNKEQDLKNKEAVYMTPTSSVTTTGAGTSTTTWTNPVSGSIWILDQLKSKEMVVKYTTSVTSSGNTSTDDVTYTFSQE